MKHRENQGVLGCAQTLSHCKGTLKRECGRELWTTAAKRPQETLHYHGKRWEPNPKCTFKVFFFQLTQFITFYSQKGTVICSFYLIHCKNQGWNRVSEDKSSVFLQSSILMAQSHNYLFSEAPSHLVQMSSSEWKKIVLWMPAILWNMELRNICRNQHYLWSPVETHFVCF